MLRTKKLVIMGVAVALMLVIPKLIIPIPVFGFSTVKIGFGFIITFLVATQLSPLSGGLVAAVANVLFSFLFPVRPYFPGFTLTSFLAGIIVGCLVNFFSKVSKNENSFLVYFISILLARIFAALLNTLWLWLIFSKTSFMFILFSRLASDGLTALVIAPICFELTKYFKFMVKSSYGN